MSKTTPGPWTYFRRSGNIVAATDDSVAHLSVLGTAEDGNLIAAAPDLLAALKVCVDELRKLSFKDSAITAALERSSAAIAKAGGAV